MANGRHDDFATSIRVARAKADISQDELAERLGVSRATVTNWETGVTWPTLRTAVKISEVLGVTLNELAGVSPAQA